MMKKIYTTLLSLLVPMIMMAQGWPQNYGGVMLQAFYWDSYDDTNWTILTQQADELATTFDLIWIPQSADCGGTSMGYDDLYWFPGHYKSSFGSEQELKTMISTFKQKGLKTIADVVINHRKSNNGWFGFPTETYNGVTYTMGPADVCGNDDGGKAKTEANRLGVTLGANDTGEGWDGMRDLDHTAQNVQNTCKAYTKMLIDYFGYAGFRYDMVKGYKGEYTKLYNNYAKPEFSVGECWDGTNTIKTWIDATDKTSAAFDFQFRYTVRNAANNDNNWTALGQQNEGNWPLISTSTYGGSYRQYAVTFVENHDTEKRSNADQDPLKKDTLAANAFMLALPGTPCIFLTHWQAYKQQLSTMVAIRKAVGVHNMSTYAPLAANSKYYAIRSIGTNGTLAAVVGTDAAKYTPTGDGWVKVFSGYHFSYFVKDLTTNAVWADLASGTYENPQKVTLTAITSNPSAQLVYTTNGSNPTASSTKVANGTTITIPLGTMTLKVGLIVNNTVSSIITRNYTITEPKPTTVTIPSFCTVSAGEVCAFFEAPATWRNTIKCWAWGNGGTPNYTGGTWPGEACTKLGNAANGNAVWKWTYKGSLTTQPNFIIFNNDDSPKTADLPFYNGGYYTKDGYFASVPAGIDNVINEPVTNSRIYTLDGRMMPTTDVNTLPRGIYIVNGKKIVR